MPTITIKPEISLDAVKLVEDVAILALIIELLRSVDCDSITEINTVEDRRMAEDMMRSTLALARSWHRVARLKLRHDFLAK